MENEAGGGRKWMGLPRPAAIVLLAWTVISVPFVIYQLWSNLEKDYYRRGVDEGRRTTAELLYRDIIEKASNAQCHSIFVKQGDTRVDLINVRCLRVVSATPAPDPKTARQVVPSAQPPIKVPPQAGSADVGPPVPKPKAKPQPK